MDVIDGEQIELLHYLTDLSRNVFKEMISDRDVTI